MRTQARLAAVIAGILGLLAARVAYSGGRVEYAFDLANFTTPLLIDNAYLPLLPGLRVVVAEVSVDECIVDETQVTGDSKDDFTGAYAGLSARVVSDRAWLDADCDGGRDRLLEDTFDWYAQDDDGNVWYVGEATTAFEYDDAGNPTGTSTEGSWEAGRDGAIAGLIMLAEPAAGDFYQQEFSAGVAEDAAKVVGVGRNVTTGLGTFADCLVTKEWSSLSPGAIEHKYYCPDLGLVLVREFHGKTTIAETVDIDMP
ncbi:hypothetical protein [Lysobacter solisilvae (ex Woo and Kim 2020)]|uniref:Uncharacterized protein n=1 Tax=Agrilutibacter terrestris TaxID=2865112 RepID=A0A7H0FXV1_9GAMM|nr:hypothetical protein [Lysobacter terrestris]QNP40867.1 hypothetical protein H8B22_00970 [Lysobacter terrestris]